MNEIVKEFNGSKVRIVEKDGIHWFVAKDICKYFGVPTINVLSADLIRTKSH